MTVREKLAWIGAGGIFGPPLLVVIVRDLHSVYLFLLQFAGFYRSTAEPLAIICVIATIIVIGGGTTFVLFKEYEKKHPPKRTPRW